MEQTNSTILAGLATTTQANAPTSPLQQVLDGHNNQLEKLNDLISTLANRLALVRNQRPQNDGTETEKPMPSTSPVVGQLLNATAQVTYMQSRVSELLEDLEV